MPNLSHSKAGAYFGNFKEPTGIIPSNNTYGIPTTGVPASLAAIAGGNANVTADSPPAMGSGTMGANTIMQYGLFLNGAPSATQQAQGYLQFAAVGSDLATSMWLPTNIQIINFDVNLITTWSGATSPTLSIGAVNANNGTFNMFAAALVVPTTGVQQVSTQGVTTYNVANFSNIILNPTGNPVASSALNTTATVNGVSVTQPLFNLTVRLGGSTIPATAAMLLAVEYVYFGDTTNY